MRKDKLFKIKSTSPPKHSYKSYLIQCTYFAKRILMVKKCKYENIFIKSVDKAQEFQGGDAILSV
jgi:hypothetical protein